MFRRKTSGGSSSNLRKRTTQVLPTEDTGIAEGFMMNHTKNTESNSNNDNGNREDGTATAATTVPGKRHLAQGFGPTRSKFAKRSQLQTKIQEKQLEAEQLHQRAQIQKSFPSPTEKSSTVDESRSVVSGGDRDDDDNNDNDDELFSKEEIAKIRAEKQMLRNKMNDYIPIRTNAVTGKPVSSTVMFGVPNSSGSDPHLGRGSTLADLVDSDGSDSSDSDSWVMEQVSKGTTKQSIEMLRQEYIQKKSNGNSNNNNNNNDDSSNDEMTASSHTKMLQKPAAPFGALNFRFIKYTTCDEITREIDASISTLSEGIRSSEARVAGYKKDIDETLQEIADSKAQAVENEKSHAFFCQLNEFVRNMVDFLSEKAPEIEDIEQRLADLQREHNKFRRAQRTTLIQRTEAMAYTATAPYDPPEKFSARTDLGDLLTIGELGEAAEEMAKFATARTCLLEEATALLSDTDDEYKAIENILKPFAQWKNDPTTAASYRQAYCSMVLPLLLAPLVRYELLTWDPLPVKGQQQQELLDMKWLKAVREFSTESTPSHEKDPDAGLATALVRSSVLPKVREALTNGDWSPFDPEQNKIAIRLTKSLLDAINWNTESDVADELLSTAIATLQDTVETVKLPGMPRCTAVGSGDILKRLFDRALSLFGCVCEWALVMKENQSTLQGLAIGNLLNTRLLPFLKTLKPEDAYTAASIVIECLPKDWRMRSLPPLQPFVRFTEMIATTIKKDLSIRFV